MIDLAERVTKIKNEWAQLNHLESKEAEKMALDGAVSVLSVMGAVLFPPLWLVTITGAADFIRRGFKIADLQEKQRDLHSINRLVRRRGQFILKQDLPRN